MLLTVYIKDLVIAGRHGVHDHEKKSPQRFRVSVELELSSDRAASSDDLADTMDWSRFRDEIVKIVEGKSYDLVERLAGEIAAAALKDERVAKASVSVDKIDAFESGAPGVRLELQR